jgi:hypothetical protein
MNYKNLFDKSCNLKYKIQDSSFLGMTNTKSAIGNPAIRNLKYKIPELRSVISQSLRFAH